MLTSSSNGMSSTSDPSGHIPSKCYDLLRYNIKEHTIYQYYRNRTDKKYLQYVNAYQQSFREVVIGNIHCNSLLLLYNFEPNIF